MEGEASIGSLGSDVSLIVFSACAIIAGVVAQLVAWWLLRNAARRIDWANTLLKRTSLPVRFIVPLIVLQVLWLAAPHRDYIPILVHLTRVLLIVAMVWLAIRLINAVTAAIIAAQPIAAKDNRGARRIQTQALVISRSLNTLMIILGLSLVLMTFPAARNLGASLLASAGLAGIIAGVAARPVLSNLIAGMQIALSQPFHIDDVLIVDGEWGRVEEITSTYVSMRIWDERRLVIPLQWFIENPFQNWTRISSELIGTVVWWVDYRMPLEPLREQLKRICEKSREWDGKLNLIQVTDVSERAMQIRALVSAANSGDAWDLRCTVREALIQFMQGHYSEYLPRQRNDVRLQAEQQEAFSTSDGTDIPGNQQGQ